MRYFFFFRGMVSEVRIENNKLFLAPLDPEGLSCVKVMQEEVNNFWFIIHKSELGDEVVWFSVKTNRGSFIFRHRTVPVRFITDFLNFLSDDQYHKIKIKTFRFLTVYASISIALALLVFLTNEKSVFFNSLRTISLMSTIFISYVAYKEYLKFKEVDALKSSREF